MTWLPPARPHFSPCLVFLPARRDQKTPRSYIHGTDRASILLSGLFARGGPIAIYTFAPPIRSSLHAGAMSPRSYTLGIQCTRIPCHPPNSPGLAITPAPID